MILVLAQIGQIQTETPKQSPVVAMQQPIQPTNHGPLQAPQYIFSRRSAAYSVWIMAYGF
jgi:hypothetical protein